MIEVYLTNLINENTGVKAGTGKEIRIKVTGHAGFDKKDRDIVCAAASAVIQTAIIAITRIAMVRQKVKQKHGLLESVIAINKLETSKLRDLIIILNTMLVGLEEIIAINPEALRINFGKQ